MVTDKAHAGLSDPRGWVSWPAWPRRVCPGWAGGRATTSSHHSLPRAAGLALTWCDRQVRRRAFAAGRPALASSQASPCSAPWGPVGDGGSAGSVSVSLSGVGRIWRRAGGMAGSVPLGRGQLSCRASASTDLPAGGPHAPSKAHPKGRPAGLLIKKARTPCLLAEASLEGPAAAGGRPGAQAGSGDAGRASLLRLLRPRAFCQVPAGFRPRATPRGSGYLVFGNRRRPLPRSGLHLFKPPLLFLISFHDRA